jgi:hypothetical protein
MRQPPAEPPPATWSKSRSMRPSAVPRERACTIGMPFTTAPMSE